MLYRPPVRARAGQTRPQTERLQPATANKRTEPNSINHNDQGHNSQDRQPDQNRYAISNPTSTQPRIQPARISEQVQGYTLALKSPLYTALACRE